MDNLSLEQIVSQGILTVCLRQRQHLQVTLWAQRLLRTLSASEKILQQLCTKSENCPLYLMYRLCSSKRNNYDDSDKMCVYIELIKCVYNIIFVQHKNGCTVLLSNSCPCSEELVVSVILAMDRLFTHYCQMDSSSKSSHRGEHILSLLASGVTLIYTLAVSDSLFAQHHARAQMQYVRMLSGLATVFREQPKEWELHLPALEELCDFEPDSGHTSQDSEGEEQMEQS